MNKIFRKFLIFLENTILLELDELHASSWLSFYKCSKLSFYERCPEGIGRRNGKISGLLLYVKFSRPLIGQGKECYIVEEVIEVDELDRGNISAAL